MTTEQGPGNPREPNDLELIAARVDPNLYEQYIDLEVFVRICMEVKDPEIIKQIYARDVRIAYLLGALHQAEDPEHFNTLFKPTADGK